MQLGSLRTARQPHLTTQVTSIHDILICSISELHGLPDFDIESLPGLNTLISTPQPPLHIL